MARIVSPDPFFCSLLFFLSRAAAPSYLPMLLVLRLLHHLSFFLDLLTALLPRLDTDTDYGALQRLWPKHKQIRLPPTCAALSLLLSPTSPYHHIVIQGTTIGVDGTRLTRSSPPYRATRLASHLLHSVLFALRRWPGMDRAPRPAHALRPPPPYCTLVPST